jgi:hypothetical protein
VGHAARHAEGRCRAMIPTCRRAEQRSATDGEVGLWADKRLHIKVGTRDVPFLRDPTVILIDQLKEMYIDGELDPIETGLWFSKLARQVGITGNLWPITASFFGAD